MQKLLSSQPFSQQFFTVVNGQVVKAMLTVKPGEVFAKDPYVADIARKALIGESVSGTNVNLAISAASEADLLAAQKAAPEKAIEIDKLLTYLRAAKDAQAQAAAKPIRVEITNASRVCRQTWHGRSGGARWKWPTHWSSSDQGLI
jgi:hypothetical protein